MFLTVNIPKEFEKHYGEDKFEDSLKRIITDVKDEIDRDFAVSWQYEVELLEMLLTAFKESATIITVDEYQKNLDKILLNQDITENN